MTNTQLTDERLIKILSETQATIMEHNSRCVRGSVEVDARLFESMIMELQELRRAAMGSEPVGEFYEDGPLNWYQISDGDRVPSHRRIPLYRHAQPAPVVPEIDRKAIADKVYGKCSRIPGATFYNAAEFAIDEMEACRAAMLQAGNSPVIPDGYVMVPKEPTREMIWAAKSVMFSTVGWESFAGAYRAMLAAAPQEPKP